MNENPVVIFYSRSGHSKRFAENLAEKLEGELFEISTASYRWPLLGWITAGRDSLRGHAPTVTGVPELTDEQRLIVLVGPVWAGRPAAPLNTILDRLKQTKHAVAMGLTCGSKSPPENCLEYAEQRLGRPLVSSVVVCSANENWLMDNVRTRRFALECNTGVEWQG